VRTVLQGDEIPQAIDVLDESAGEAALWLVLKESDARKIVRSVETGHAYETIAILKNQPWWTELAAAVRNLAHLKPEPAVGL
jgi:hypothetical protein